MKHKCFIEVSNICPTITLNDKRSIRNRIRNMCIESLTKMLLGRRRVLKLSKSWRLKKTADDKICLLTDQDFDMEIDERATDYPESTENRVNSFDLASNCDELAISERFVRHVHTETLEGHEMLPLRCNDNKLNNRDNKSGPTRTQSMNDGISFTSDAVENVSKVFNDALENRTFISKHIYRLVKKSRRLSQKSYKETKVTEEQATAANMLSTENLSDIAEAVEMQFESLEERCRYYWNSNSDSDDELDLDDNDRSCDSLSELDDTFLSGVTDINSYETNGVTEVSIHEEDSGLNLSDKSLGDGNDSFRDESTEMNDASFLSDSDDSFSDMTDCEIDSLNEARRNSAEFLKFSG